jgi:hypothetical protein
MKRKILDENQNCELHQKYFPGARNEINGRPQCHGVPLGFFSRLEKELAYIYIPKGPNNLIPA